MPRQVERREVVASPGEGAVLARAGRIRVVEVARVGRQKVGHVRRAGLAGRGVEDSVLLLLALDVDVPEDRDKETADEVVERVEVVEPVSCGSGRLTEGLKKARRGSILTPEGSDLAVGHKNTTEVNKDCALAMSRYFIPLPQLTRDEKRVHQRSEDGVGRVRRDELSDPGVQELVQRHLEIHRASHAGLE